MILTDGAREAVGQNESRKPLGSHEKSAAVSEFEAEVRKKKGLPAETGRVMGYVNRG